MKKVIFIMLFSVLGSFLFANNEVKLNNESNGIVSEIEDDALYCKITYPDGTVYECWFCPCDQPIVETGTEPDTGTGGD